MRFWLETYDFNLPLLDALSDPELDDVRVQLAAISLGEGLDSGYYEAAELADAVSAIWSEVQDRVSLRLSDAKLALADLLDRAGPGYQDRLCSVVKPCAPAIAARQLHWLAAQMKERADMYRVLKAAGVKMPA